MKPYKLVDGRSFSLQENNGFLYMAGLSWAYSAEVCKRPVFGLELTQPQSHTRPLFKEDIKFREVNQK